MSKDVNQEERAPRTVEDVKEMLTKHFSIGVLGEHLFHIFNGSGSTFFLIDFFAQ